MHPEETKPRFHVGMRNLKTALSVSLCLLFYRLTGLDGAFLAAVAAIICLQESVEKSVSIGIHRLTGTAFGAFMGMIFLYIDLYFPSRDLSILLATAGVVVFILFCNALRVNDSIVIGCVVFLSIVLQQSSGSPFWYSVNRLLDTAIGVVFAILINRFIRNPDRLPQNAGEDGEIPGQISFEDTSV